MSVEQFSFVIDVVGTCNLSCPSCPVGNFREVRQAKGLMSPSTLAAIVAKAKSESEVEYVALYNWTEPLLHPELPTLIRSVHSGGGGGARCYLSTNLNRIANIEAVLREEPELLRISLSGNEQATYGRTHRDGNIERVKSNMQELARVRDRVWSGTKIQVAFHRYLGNHGDEAAMRGYATSLGFEFVPLWAYLMPLEKNLAYLGDTSTAAVITEDDRRLIETLALRPDEASAVAKAYKSKPCELLTKQIALDVDGNVMLCCSVYDRSRYVIGRYLDLTLAEIQRRRSSHQLCGPCTDRGLHVIGTYGTEELDRVALERVRAVHPEADWSAPAEQISRAPRRRLQRITKGIRRAVRALQRRD